MKSGGWTQAESYRDLIKDKEAGGFAGAAKPDAADRRIARSANRRDLRAASGRAAECRSSRGDLGALNEQKEDLESAIAWYQYAADLTTERPAWSERFPICA